MLLKSNGKFSVGRWFCSFSEDNLVAHLEKYRKDTDWAQGMLDDMTQNAKIQDFHLKKRLYGEFIAHRLLHLAKSIGK
jgi:hypothetical protein